MTIISAIKNSYRQAKQSRYPSLRLKMQVFKILLKLYWKRASSARAEDGLVTEYMFGFKISASSYDQILSQFQEIVLKLQYHFMLPKPSPRIIDGGANIGLTVILYKLLYPRSFIVAFEPDPDLYKLLQKNLKQNKIRNVKTYNASLADAETEVNFYPNENPLFGSQIQRDGSKAVMNVPARRLSSELQNDQYDVVKLDVEGSEWDVINDLVNSNTLNNARQYLIAFHPAQAPSSTREKIIEIFQANGFTMNQRLPHYTTETGQEVVLSFQKN